MSSSQSFLPSSQISQVSPGRTRRPKSKYSFKQLNLLSQSSTSCPLRVIAHIDLDAFYAQCEGVRLGIAEDQPLAVQQWQGLIAINYPARKFGLTRHIEINKAKELCPELILQHVATWKEGDEKWQYHKDAFANIATHKVSLDPYRRESRRILACIKDHLPPAPLQRVEKASIDEVFLDLSAQVHSILVERYPEISGPPPYNDPSERLPLPPTTALDWDTDALVDLDESQSEYEDPDWDDIAILVGSQIVRGVRSAIREQLKYTCSAGIARNKMIAKLGSAYKKPNQQTIVRNRAVQHFLEEMKFTKIRNLGGKLGDEIVAKYGTDQVKEMLDFSLDQLKVKLGDDTGSWVYHIIRGEDSSEVNARTQIKSMLSAKSFRPTINSPDQAMRWLRIFVADIFSRLVEEGVTENKRRPRTLNLHHRQAMQTRSRQVPIPTGKAIDETVLFDLAKTLLGQIVVDGRAWPCNNLSLSVGGFEEGLTGNKGIGGFLVRGEEAKAMAESAGNSSEWHDTAEAPNDRSAKRARTDGSTPLTTFFQRKSSASPLPRNSRNGRLTPDRSHGEDEWEHFSGAQDGNGPDDHATEIPSQSADHGTTHQTSITEHFCPRCNATIPVANKPEHDDWHFARDLQRSEQTSSSVQQQTSRPLGSNITPASGRASAPGRDSSSTAAAKKLEKGQSRLVFGK